MKAARLVVLMVAIGAGGIAALLAGRTEKPPETPVAAPAKPDTIDILVARSDIAMGQTVSPGEIQWQPWPANAATGNFIRKSDRPAAIENLSGQIARVPFVAGEPIREAKLVNAKGSGFMAAILPQGMRAMSIQISPETGAGGFILPNDRVDVVLSRRGNGDKAAEAQQAFDLASRLVGDTAKVVNGISVRGRDQVMLKVTVAEVRRDVIKQLGIDLSGTSLGQLQAGVTTQNPFSAVGQTITGTKFTGTEKGITATLRAMDRAGVMRTLAEPNLTAISGETATFIAGGEFPIPNGLSCDTTKSPPVCQAQVDFKKFGVSLVFTPVVLSEGRISLKVMTEVSDLSTDNALTLSVPGSDQTLTIPSITTRRAETTVEIPSGGSLSLAGMIQEKTKSQINGIPGLMQLPILGALFKSRDYINNQTELVVIVTPYMVRAVAQKQLSRPDDGFADPNDPSNALLGRLNRIYGSANKPEPKQAGNGYHGKYGFILD